jgi:hypothetical protein
MAIKSNFTNFTKEDILKLLDLISNIKIFENPQNITLNPKDFYNSNITYQYIEVIIKLKSIFAKETLKNDSLFLALWNNKISDSKCIQELIKNIPDNILVENISSLLCIEEDNPNFFQNIIQHFNEINASPEYTLFILQTIIEQKKLTFETARILK